MNVIFIENQLCIRGTTVALYDYAKFNEIYLGNISYIATPDFSDLTALPKFEEIFSGRIIIYQNLEELTEYCKSNNIDIAYHITGGIDCGNIIPVCKNVYHSVFNVKNDRITAYVSRWLSDQNYGAPYVPHIVHLPELEGDYRETLNLPSNALIVGRYGGFDQFDVPYAPNAIAKALDRNSNLYFLLMNTRYIGFDHPRIVYLEGTTDLEVKRAFMNTLDAFLHCRQEGESFGLAVCEALFCDKPVITNLECRDRHHIQVLGDKGFYYTSEDELATILAHFEPDGYKYSKLVEEFNPQAVMEKFKKTFLN